MKYRLKNEFIDVGINDVGAAVEYLRVRLADGWQDVCLAFDDPQKRISSGTYCGAAVGRVANRIAGASFSLNGKKYSLSANDGANTLHGGKVGFDSRRFECVASGGDFVRLRLVSEDGDMGFPATLVFTVEYKLTEKALRAEFFAESDGDTVFAPTLHAYFRFGGAMDALLKIAAKRYLPTDGQAIPTGESAEVAGTPFDFTVAKPVGRDIDCDCEQLRLAHGYDHCFVLDGSPAAVVEGGGVRMTLTTDFEGLQLYTGNYFRKSRSCPYSFREGFALEPQCYPNAVNEKNFPSPILRKGQRKTYFIQYTFDRP